MAEYAAGGRNPFPLAKIRRRRARRRPQAAAGEVTRQGLLEWTLAAAVPRAVASMEGAVAERVGDVYGRWDGRQGYRNGTAPGYALFAHGVVPTLEGAWYAAAPAG